MFAKPPVQEQPAPVQQPAPTNDDANVRAARVLALAQDTADRLTGSARADADAMFTRCAPGVFFR